MSGEDDGNQSEQERDQPALNGPSARELDPSSDLKANAARDGGAEHKSEISGETAQETSGSENPAQRRFWSDLNVREWITAFATVAAVLVAAVSVYVARHSDDAFQGQLRVMQRQLAVMEAQNRPWISVELKNPTDISELEGGLFGLVEAHITNSGNAPAGDIWVQGKRVAVAEDFIEIVKLGQTTRDYCDEWSNGHWMPLHGPGVTLFPGQTDWSAIAISLKREKITPFVGKTKRFLAGVIGCVSYTFYQSPVRHRTGFFYLIGDSNKDTIFAFSNPEITMDKGIPKKDVRIVKVSSGSYAD